MMNGNNKTMSEQEKQAMNEAEQDNVIEEEKDIFEDDIVIENDAVLTVDVVNNTLVVLYGGGRNAVMDFRDEEELMIAQQVLADPNFWANFLGTFSAALGKTNG